jgi:hypothetical protein
MVRQIDQAVEVSALHRGISNSRHWIGALPFGQNPIHTLKFDALRQSPLLHSLLLSSQSMRHPQIVGCLPIEVASAQL